MDKPHMQILVHEIETRGSPLNEIREKPNKGKELKKGKNTAKMKIKEEMGTGQRRKHASEENPENEGSGKTRW